MYDEVRKPRPPPQPSVPVEKTRMADRTDIANLICRVKPSVIREASGSITAMQTPRAGFAGRSGRGSARHRRE